MSWAPPGESERDVGARDMRVLPRSLKAEQAYLGAVLLNNRALDDTGPLEPVDFFEPVHARLFAACRSALARGEVADPVTLLPAFRLDPDLREAGGADYLRDLALAAETVVTAREYARHIRALAMRRRMILAAEQLASRLYDPDTPLDLNAEIAAEQAAAFGGFVETPDALDPELHAVGERIANRIAEGWTMYSTGLPSLDESMGGDPKRNIPGGMRPRVVYGIEARPKAGKTLMAATIFHNVAAAGIACDYFSLDMDPEDIGCRLIAGTQGFNAGRFSYADWDYATPIVRHLAQIHPGIARVHDVPGLSFDRLRALASEAVARHGSKVLFVDYWQCVGGKDARTSRQEHLEEIAEWARTFVRKTDTVFWLLSQENRGGESFGGDGLLRACGWLAEMDKVDATDEHGDPCKGLVLNLKANRFGDDGPIGEKGFPALYIDRKAGPVIRETAGAGVLGFSATGGD